MAPDHLLLLLLAVARLSLDKSCRFFTVHVIFRQVPFAEAEITDTDSQNPFKVKLSHFRN